MNLAYILLSVFVVSYFFISYYKRQRIYILSKKLESAYDLMELNFIQNGKVFSNEEIAYLKVYKQMSTNPQLLDIHLLLISKISSDRESIKKSKIDFDKMYKLQDDNFKKLVEKFDESADKLVKISFFNSSFLLFIVRVFVSVTLYKGQYNVITRFHKLRNDFKFVLKNENILIQQEFSPC